MKQKVLITAALPYANGPLHFGHIAGAYLPGDCYARFQRLMGQEVLYICGSDEHGVAITLSAEMAKRSPKSHVDHFDAVIRDFFSKLQMSFDYFGRTTAPLHAPLTQDFFAALERKGYIEERVVEQLYSEQEGRFLADRYVVGTCPKCGFSEARGDECQRCASSYEATDLKEPRSRLSGSPLVLRKATHYYLLFDQFKERLSQWIEGKPWKDNVLHFAKRYIEELKPRAITRDGDWGVPVLGKPGKIFYVWFDAPIGYISITQEWAQKKGNPDLWKEYWLDPKTKLVQFLGKDNIPFHAVFFPAMLMGQDLPYKLPDELPANEFFLLEGRQFSKSDGWTVDLDDFFSRYTADQARYAIAANAPETADAEFSWKDFQMRCNTELLGKLGNFVHRVLTFAHRFMGGKVPKEGKRDVADEAFYVEIERLVHLARASYESFQLRRSTQILMELCTAGNVYFDQKKPWALAKDPASLSVLETMLYASLVCIKQIALVAAPILPESAEKIWSFLGFQTPLAKEGWGSASTLSLPAGQSLKAPEVLFRKIEDEEVIEQVTKLGKKEQKAPASSAKPPISYDHFSGLDLRVVEVVSAEPVPKSKKLLKLVVDLGSEKRIVVSGIAGFYTPEQVIGKKCILVANLAPAKIMGVESHGMILAGSNSDQLSLLEAPSSLPLGSIVS